MQHNLWNAATLRRFRLGMPPQIFRRYWNTEFYRKTKAAQGRRTPKSGRSA